jgi:hypothetical protein
MSAYGNQDQALSGLMLGLDPRIETGAAQEDIGFGEPVMSFVGDEEEVYALHADHVLITLDADLVASNVITTVVNGTSVATTYATSHAATMTAHIAAINANGTIAALGDDFLAAPGDTNRKIDLKVKGVDLTVTCAVTLGASQAGVTVATDTWGMFKGVAIFKQTGGADYGAGTSGFKQYDAVDILAEGDVWVPVAAAVSANDPAYIVIAAGADQGKFTDSASATYNMGGFFRTNRNSQNLAVLEVRGMK